MEEDRISSAQIIELKENLLLKIGDGSNDGIEEVEIILEKLRLKLKSYVQFQEKKEKWKG